jgi:hypothetical protein
MAIASACLGVLLLVLIGFLLKPFMLGDGVHKGWFER